MMQTFSEKKTKGNKTILSLDLGKNKQFCLSMTRDKIMNKQ